jgi:hypothetical protein
MKKALLILSVAVFAFQANSQTLGMNRYIQQPAFAQPCTTANFATADSSCKTIITAAIVPASGYTTGDWAIAKGIGCRANVDSGVVFVHPIYAASNVRFGIKMRGGDILGFVFDKIWRSNTTITLDSLSWFPATN